MHWNNAALERAGDANHAIVRVWRRDPRQLSRPIVVGLCVAVALFGIQTWMPILGEFVRPLYWIIFGVALSLTILSLRRRASRNRREGERRTHDRRN